MNKSGNILGIVALALISSQSAYSDSRDYVDYSCAKKVFGEIDISKNGTISLNEFLKADYTTTLFDKIKLNKKDSNITLGEFFIAMEESVLKLETCPNIQEFRTPNH